MPAITLETGFKTPFCPREKLSYATVLLCNPLLDNLQEWVLGENRLIGGLFLTGWAATCSEGFVVNFLKVLIACWGSSVAAVQPNSLGNSQKTFIKPFRTSGRPTWYIRRSYVRFLGFIKSDFLGNGFSITEYIIFRRHYSTDNQFNCTVFSY